MTTSPTPARSTFIQLHVPSIREMVVVAAVFAMFVLIIRVTGSPDPYSMPASAAGGALANACGADVAKDGWRALPIIVALDVAAVK